MHTNNYKFKMSGVMRRGTQNKVRVRLSNNRKWLRNEELALIAFMKRNHNFEKPSARVYYTQFIYESGIHIDWRLLRSKVRNMRTTYRKAKECEISNADSKDYTVQDLRIKILKMCWYVDDFDIIFPMDNISDKHSHRLFDDEFSKDESSGNIDKSRENFKINEEESTGSSVSKSIDEDNISVERNTLPIKKEKQDETGTLNKSNYEKNKLQQQIRQRDIEVEFQQTPFRNRTNPIRKWQRQEEVTLILFLKENTDFEKPNARMYYTKFLFESTIDADWKHVRNKVRNMRVSYRKAKEHEIKEADSNSVNLQSLRNQMLKICWFMDDFDILFPNDMDNSACLEIYRNPDPILDDEFSRDYSPNNVDDSSKNFNSIFLPDDESSASSLPNCIDEDILTVHKNVLDLEKEHQKEKYSLRQQELELAKEKLNFEKAKFREEIRLKEREIENEEKLKMMEFQMEERIALKKLEIEEMLALKSMKRPDNSYIYHNLT